VSGGRLAAIRAVVPPRHLDGATRLDVVGAVTVTAATGSFIYGMLNADEEGWTDLGTLVPGGPPSSCTGVFVVVERTVPAPLMRLNLLARRSIAAGAFFDARRGRPAHRGAFPWFAVSAALSRPQRAADQPVLPARPWPS
jgi:hypothetical protein